MADELWLAYYPDWSGFAVFESEIEALRAAVDRHMEVAKVRYGDDLLQQVNAQWQQARAEAPK